MSAPDEQADLFDAMPELPAASERRWTVRRKAAVIEGVRGGWVPIEEACRLYGISVDEFLAWERDIEEFGVPGLRTTRYQIYRSSKLCRRPRRTGSIGLGGAGDGLVKRTRPCPPPYSSSSTASASPPSIQESSLGSLVCWLAVNPHAGLGGVWNRGPGARRCRVTPMRRARDRQAIGFTQANRRRPRLLALL